MVPSSEVPNVLGVWKGELVANGKEKLAALVADPLKNAELFEEGWEDALAREQSMRLMSGQS